MFIYKLLHNLIPNFCRLCEEPLYSREIICSRCLSKIKKITPPFCNICGRPSIADGHEDNFMFTCNKCHNKKHPFDKIVSAAYYDEHMRKMIHLFKYKAQTSLARHFSKLLLAPVKHLPKIDIITYVPIHKNRLKTREFNQSYLLAKKLAELMKVELAENDIKRVRNSPPQVGLSRKERMKNLQGIFKVTNNKSFINNNILLIDDIYTTGSTIHECSKAIKTSGARAVFAATIAMSLPD